MTYEYSNACDAAGLAAEQAQRDTNGIEPLEMDTRNKRQYMSIHPATYGESVWLDK